VSRPVCPEEQVCLALAIHAGPRLTGASTQKSAPDLER
jgi:hypothetical protein